MEDQVNLYELLQEKINFGENIIQDLTKLEHVDGVTKLQRKINQEVKFLKKINKSGVAKMQHLQCSNLNQLSALVRCILREQNVTHVDLSVILEDKKIRIDVVSNGGSSWIKVVARNPKSISDAVMGRTSFGSRNILDQAQDYLQAAKLHPCVYQTPQVIFEFASGIESKLALELETLGITVRVPDTALSETENSTSAENCSPNNLEILYNINTLNLDVTCMLAYVSSLCNGKSHFEFKETLLTEQASWERERPLKCILDELFKGKEIVCCETAYNAFNEIVTLIGGPLEKQRARELLERVVVMSDTAGSHEHQETCASLVIEGRIKERSKVIFSFGHAIKAITVTANEGFVRAAKQQGLELAVFLHEARALTEKKEPMAKSLLGLGVT